MNINDVDIYFCKFFTLNQDKKLQFHCGKYKGKTASDFTTVSEIWGATGYCFWIILEEGVPKVSQYTASLFLKDLTSGVIELERITRRRVIQEQKEMKEKTEELTKTVGYRYGSTSE